MKIFKHLNALASKVLPGWRGQDPELTSTSTLPRHTTVKKTTFKRNPAKSRRRGYAGHGRIPRAPWRRAR